MRRQYHFNGFLKKQPITQYSRASFASQPQLPVEEDIVDSFLRIMEDGPLPMKGGKPADKVKNGVDAFDEEHQAPYDSRARSNTDWVKAADRHSRAYPALYDELDKRRSVTKPPPKEFCYVAKRISDDAYHRKDKSSTRPRRRARPRRRCKPKPRKTKRPREVSRSRHRYQSARINKRRRHYRKTNYTDKNCQYCLPETVSLEITKSNNTHDLRKSREDSARVIKNIMSSRHLSDASEEYAVDKKKSFQSGRSIRSVKVDKISEHSRFFYKAGKAKSSSTKSAKSGSEMECENPDSNKTSLTAYESYTSIDHEPMIPK